MTDFLPSSRYTNPLLRGAYSYLLPVLLNFCRARSPSSRILDVGCGNGSIATQLAGHGYAVTGIDLATSSAPVAFPIFGRA